MDFQKMKTALVAAAERAGLTEYEIYGESESSVSVDILKDEVSSFSSGTRGGINFRCIVNGRLGSASGELMTEEAMEELVARAVSNAAVIDSEDIPEIFAGSGSYATVTAPEPVPADPSALKKLALDLQAELYRQSDKVGDGTGTYAVSETRDILLVNSKGLSLSNRVGVTGVYVEPVVREGEEAQNVFRVREGSTMEQLAGLPAEAVSCALSRLGAGTIPSGKYNIVFSGEQLRQFLATFAPVFSAEQAQKGLSLLAGKEGQTVAAECVTLTDDPMREGASVQTAFDGEGVATCRKQVIEKGVLKTLLYDLTSAKKAGVPSTGNGQRRGYASAVSIAPYHFSLEAGNGIYITTCKGFHAGANSVTGDFSIESEGFRIRDGKQAEPIRSFTVAGNFFDLLREIACVGDTVLWGFSGGFTVYGAPDVLVRGMSVAGKDA